MNTYITICPWVMSKNIHCWFVPDWISAFSTCITIYPWVRSMHNIWYIFTRLYFVSSLRFVSKFWLCLHVADFCCTLFLVISTGILELLFVNEFLGCIKISNFIRLNFLYSLVRFLYFNLPMSSERVNNFWVMLFLISWFVLHELYILSLCSECINIFQSYTSLNFFSSLYVFLY